MLDVAFNLFGDECVDTTTVVCPCFVADCVGVGCGGCLIGVFWVLDTMSLISSSDESSSVPTLVLFR